MNSQKTMRLLGIFIIGLLLSSVSVLADGNDRAAVQNRQPQPGTPSINFRYPDLNGKMVMLKDFKGKYIYIDIWATWCGPCKAEIPHLKQLEKDMKGKKIVFMSISCDTDKAAWEKYVKEQQLGGIQLWMGNGKDIKDFYGVRTIPRFILLDRKGNIIDANMTRPSDEKTKTTLLKLKGI